MKSVWIALALIAPATHCLAQSVGSVSPAEAAVARPNTPALQPVSGRLDIPGGATVTAYPGHNATVSMKRGGSILVCQSTGVHMSAGNGDSLLLALDRGALEIRMKSQSGDVIQTPDLRLSLAGPGELDLRMHVTFNGDTCVENRGHKSPAINVTDSFTNAAYLVKPGQHLMFEHGSLRTVEDRETTPCGCPPDSKSPLSADAHPFPEAVSAGLAEPTPGVPEATGVRHVEVDSTLKFDPSDPTAAAAAQSSLPATRTPGPKPGFFASIGHFFKHLFVR